MGLACPGEVHGHWDSRASLVSALCLSSCGCLAIELWLPVAAPHERSSPTRSRTLALCSQVGFSSPAAAAKSLQSCPTLCDPIDGSPPGSPVPGILQARTLEWLTIAFCAQALNHQKDPQHLS